MLLLRFVCSFAWADLTVRSEEREFVGGLVDRLDLSEDEILQVHRWLELPPSPEAVDPNLIPDAHRRLFVEAIQGVIRADGEVAVEEQESLDLLRQLIET